MSRKVKIDVQFISKVNKSSLRMGEGEINYIHFIYIVFVYHDHLQILSIFSPKHVIIYPIISFVSSRRVDFIF